jgi:hypothetical protein
MLCVQTRLVLFKGWLAFSCRNVASLIDASQECQRAHWKKHKIGMPNHEPIGARDRPNLVLDCNHTLRSDKWMPAWRREGRPPSFITDSEEDNRLELGEFNGGTTL